jgi:hypothetical protein
MCKLQIKPGCDGTHLNPSIWEAEVENCEFKSSLGHVASLRPACEALSLKSKNKRMTTKDHNSHDERVSENEIRSHAYEKV